MLQRTCGTIPVPSTHLRNPTTAAAVHQLQSIKTFGGIIVDEPGFGKTPLALLFASYHAMFAAHVDENGAPSQKPMLFVVPPGAVISQWQEMIHTLFPQLTLVISNGEKPPASKFVSNWVSNAAMRDAPDRLDKWPEHLKYMFDTQDPRASKASHLP
ncbi:hypothetical protein MMC17_001014 [Xylographa soralifera]|nr:hypothetical protein [Xylographa soralifera]